MHCQKQVLLDSIESGLECHAAQNGASLMYLLRKLVVSVKCWAGSRQGWDAQAQQGLDHRAACKWLARSLLERQSRQKELQKMPAAAQHLPRNKQLPA